jgi:hypothetical protein
MRSRIEGSRNMGIPIEGEMVRVGLEDDLVKIVLVDSNLEPGG